MPVPLTADEQRSARLLWRVYAPLQDEIDQSTRALFADHPEMGPVIAAAPREPDPAQRVALRAAFEQGAWEAYWDNTRAQGAGYAQTGASLSSWFEVVNHLRTILLDAALQTYDGDPDARRRALWALGRWLDDVMGVFGQSFLDASQEVVRRQEQAIRQLSTPVLQVLPQILVLPIVGLLDADRVRRLTDGMLSAIAQRRARALVLDLTGVPDMDTVSAQGILQGVQSAQLMGAHVIISGMAPDMAQALVTVGVDLSGIDTVGDLEGGLVRARLLVGEA